MFEMRSSIVQGSKAYLILVEVNGHRTGALSQNHNGQKYGEYDKRSEVLTIRSNHAQCSDHRCQNARSQEAIENQVDLKKGNVRIEIWTII